MRQALDLSLYRWIESQTSESDRSALLSLQEAVCAGPGTYNYLEIGSHLGGSLQPHVVDPRCLRIFSIDPRPSEQPDERWADSYKYEGNSTERMLTLLSAIPEANIGKIQTFEVSSWELSPTSISAPIDYAFVDGEHTNFAVLRDFDSVRRYLSPKSIVAFHDCFATLRALQKIQRMLKNERVPHAFLHFPKSVVVAIVFDSERLTASLLDFGWRKGLPIWHWQRLKLFSARRFPRAFSLARRCLHFFLRK